MNELFDAAINTYAVLIMGDDPYDMLNKGPAPFMLDISDYPYMSHDMRIGAAESSMEVLAEHDHFEKCIDLQEYIKKLKDEVQGLSK